MIISCPCGCGETWDDTEKLPGNRTRKWAIRSICRKRWTAKHGPDREFTERCCVQCGESFTPESSNRATCSETCEKAKLAAPRHDKTKDAPPHVRESYCWQEQKDRRVRCRVHIETCGGGCYKTENGKPICRVEPCEIGG